MKQIIIAITLLSIAVGFAVAQAPDQTVVMNDADTLAVVCYDMSLDVPPGDTIYITCNQAQQPPIATATPTAVSSPTPTAVPASTQTATFLPTITNTAVSTATPILPTVTAVSGSERGRVQIVNNNIIADNGYPLRGDATSLSNTWSTSDYSLNDIYGNEFWNRLKLWHMNTARLLIMQPPQYGYSGATGWNCYPPNYRCYELGYVFLNGKTTLEVVDDFVDRAAVEGMYAIIDYHPVGGYSSTAAAEWWTAAAPRYANRTHVIYEAANEPVQWTAEQYNTAAVQFETDMYALIRSLAPDTHIILWSIADMSDGMASKVGQAGGVNYSNASVGFHAYANTSLARINTLRSAYPIFCTEFGLWYEPRLLYDLGPSGSSWIALDLIWHDSLQYLATWPADPGVSD